MNTINLLIGGVDVSEFVETESYSVRKVRKTGQSFTKYDGTDVTPPLGFYYEITVSLEDIRDADMRALTAAVDNDDFSVTFTDPHTSNCTTAQFVRGESTGGTVSGELDDGLYWNVSLSLKSKLIGGDGL